jgi:hypothetical protein
MATFENIIKAEYWIAECTKLKLFCIETHKIEIKEVGVELSTIKFKELGSRVKEVLKETDWTQLSDTLLTKPKLKSIYREYRRYVRGVEKSYNNDTVLNYKILEFEEWLKMKSYFKFHDYEG